MHKLLAGNKELPRQPAAAAYFYAPDEMCIRDSGYTLLFGTSGPLAINVSLYKNQGYNPETSFAPIIRLSLIHI